MFVVRSRTAAPSTGNGRAPAVAGTWRPAPAPPPIASSPEREDNEPEREDNEREDDEREDNEREDDEREDDEREDDEPDDDERDGEPRGQSGTFNVQLADAAPREALWPGVAAFGTRESRTTMMMEMFGGVFMMLLFGYSLIPLFPFVYVVLRWRQGREGETPDPQLGLKVALHYFATIGLHVVLMALVAVLYSFMVDSSRVSESMMRAGAGLLIGGGLVLGGHIMMLRRVTDSASRPNVARVFAGLNLVLCGLIGTGAVIATSVMLLQENVPEDAFKIAMVMLAVYLGCWGLQARKLIAYSSPA